LVFQAVLVVAAVVAFSSFSTIFICIFVSHLVVVVIFMIFILPTFLAYGLAS